MNNITIGQYIPGNSWLHKLDPRFKLLSLVFLLVGTFIIPISADLVPVISMGLIFIGIILLTLSTGIPMRKVINGLRPIVFLLTFTFFIQLFYVKSGTLLASYEMFISVSSIFAIIAFILFYNFTKKYVKTRILYFFFAAFMVFFIQASLPYISITSYTLDVYDEGLIRAGFIFIRIANVIIMTSLLTFTTMTTDLNYGIESLLRPLKIIRVPVDVIAMMLSLTLRYIPTLLGETEKIMKAQASRGVDFKESKFKDKVIQIISLLIPVFVISFKRAEDLGNAMEVRGYVIGAPRTRIDEYNIGYADVLTLIMAMAFLALIIYTRVIA
ncbi:energy-coupling factor transporter transmembrane component T family protein [Peloplasma aerotolerans]|jgi:energy-coupling factor transport system permease protein|uniref:Energy-coupling factor transporter transmembrane component T n=1 Tax=Peloplasma aerotolerans TaxID=3044389 RepID=A0AAW6U9B3_9MOLU|nr:energy-coupling factor transporter transmembrane component T [Mariniplasma sp. M4Ah]MDI6453290.1 energy-coupling factor transporter transmembrane component T [Mariniplasma sp. M4Ah]